MCHPSVLTSIQISASFVPSIICFYFNFFFLLNYYKANTRHHVISWANCICTPLFQKHGHILHKSIFIPHTKLAITFCTTKCPVHTQISLIASEILFSWFESRSILYTLPYLRCLLSLFNTVWPLPYCLVPLTCLGNTISCPLKCPTFWICLIPFCVI